MLAPSPTAAHEEYTGKAMEKNRSEDEASSGTLRAKARSPWGETKTDDDDDAAVARGSAGVC